MWAFLEYDVHRVPEKREHQCLMRNFNESEYIFVNSGMQHPEKNCANMLVMWQMST